MIRVAIDGMGGDNSPFMVIQGIARAAERYPDAQFIVFGDRSKISPLLQQKEIKSVLNRIELIHTEKTIAMDESPVAAIRYGQDSSMGLALQALQKQQVDCVVSAGNTGALMGMAKIMIKLVKGIERPAIASLCPTLKGETVMLDLGANIEATPNHLVQFALMGKIFAMATLGLKKPKVALLNIGSEELKGRNEVKTASTILEELTDLINYVGYVEANEIVTGKVDVIVMDGYSGNIALKAMEGVAKFLSVGLKNVFYSSIFTKIGFLFMRSAMRHFFHRHDPRVHNGAVFLGINGIVVKSHGGTDALGFAHAICVGIDTVKHGFLDKVNSELPSLILPSAAQVKDAK